MSLRHAKCSEGRHAGWQPNEIAVNHQDVSATQTRTKSFCLVRNMTWHSHLGSLIHAYRTGVRFETRRQKQRERVARHALGVKFRHESVGSFLGCRVGRASCSVSQGEHCATQANSSGKENGKRPGSFQTWPQSSRLPVQIWARGEYELETVWRPSRAIPTRSVQAIALASLIVAKGAWSAVLLHSPSPWRSRPSGPRRGGLPRRALARQSHRSEYGSPC
eukprot:15472796-Alexandrium_andersonii.AAC.1